MQATIREYLDELSAEFGFLACGVARARRLDEEETRLKTWLERGYHGEMHYMANNMEKRLDPTLLVPGAKTVITFLHNYFPQHEQAAEAPKIARYAYGEDYHRVLKDKLYELTDRLQERAGKISGRIFVDSAPVMERQWAALAGLGWIGKNSLLLRKGTGSWFFIATLISDLDLEPDAPVTDHCGSCTACMEACPTQAIVADGVVDASKCISYLTIELKDPIPQEFHNNLSGWAFGCDICQEVCPWNRFSEPNQEPRFQPLNQWPAWDTGTWKYLTKEQFTATFGQSAITRTGFERLKDNVSLVLKNQRNS